MAPPSNESVVFLLGPRTSHADFERFARANGWVVHQDLPSTRPREAREQIWVTPDRGTAIHYLDDPTPKERFLLVYGKDTGAVSFDLGANFDITTAEDVTERALLAATDPERSTAAWQLAVVTPDYDEATLDLLKSLYYDASDLVRHAVVNAVGYRGWPEGRDFLEEVARDDPSPELRENARAIVKVRWGGADTGDSAGED